MHGQPIALIIAKREAGAPDFSGPTMDQARKDMIHAHDSPDQADQPDETSDKAGSKDMKEMHAELMDIVAELRKASETHAGQADRIEALCESMMGAEPDNAGAGEAKVFEPAE